MQSTGFSRTPSTLRPLWIFLSHYTSQYCVFYAFYGKYAPIRGLFLSSSCIKISQFYPFLHKVWGRNKFSRLASNFGRDWRQAVAMRYSVTSFLTSSNPRIVTYGKYAPIRGLFLSHYTSQYCVFCALMAQWIATMLHELKAFAFMNCLRHELCLWHIVV